MGGSGDVRPCILKKGRNGFLIFEIAFATVQIYQEAFKFFNQAGNPVHAEIICKLILRLPGDEKGFLIVTREIMHSANTVDAWT
jgi:hypothetical protein